MELVMSCPWEETSVIPAGPLVVVSAGLLVFLTGWWPHHYTGPAP